MAKITDLSSMSGIAWQAVKIQQQMQKLYSLTLPPPAIQQLMKSVEKISQITDPPAIRAIQDSMNVITKLNPACNLPWSDAFNAISQIPLDVRTDLAESFLQQLDPVEISHADVPEVTEEQEKQIDELFPTFLPWPPMKWSLYHMKTPSKLTMMPFKLMKMLSKLTWILYSPKLWKALKKQ